MKGVLRQFSRGFISGDADQLFLISILAALLFGAALYVSAKIENVLVIDNGVGLYQNYGVLVALIGDAVLLFITKKYYECLIEIGKHDGCASSDEIQSAIRETRAIIGLKTRHCGILYLLMFIGACFLMANVSQHLFGNPDIHWRGEVFDTINHPLCFASNKIFSFYSWVIVLPFCGFIGMVTSVQLAKISAILSSDESIRYDLLHPDNAGGFSSVGLATIFFNAGISVVYVQITVYINTFNGANVEHKAAYLLVTILLLFGNALSLHKIGKAVEEKKMRALNKAKQSAYKGNILEFEIYRYYIDTFSKNSFSRKVAIASLSIKMLAISIPPTLKLAMMLI